MWKMLLILLLILILAGAAVLTVKRFRHGAGCCGTHEASVRRSTVRDRDKSHYPYHIQLHIGGMTCGNCAVRVENALNALDGTWARVSLDTQTADILLKCKPDVPLLCRTVAQAGYAAQKIDTRHLF